MVAVKKLKFFANIIEGFSCSMSTNKMGDTKMLACFTRFLFFFWWGPQGFPFACEMGECVQTEAAYGATLLALKGVEGNI